MKTATAEYLSRVACELARADTGNPQAHHIAATIHTLHRLGVALHRRYEAACSYTWADTDAYRKRTASLEAKVARVAAEYGPPLTVTLQTDPRGWPLILTIGDREWRVGGEV